MLGSRALADAPLAANGVGVSIVLPVLPPDEIRDIPPRLQRVRDHAPVLRK